MKKILLTLTLVFFSLSGFSQVGINTENPQQLFHTDGKSLEQTINPKTGVPTATQQQDDVVITKEGQVGIGTISPSEKLEVNGKAKINDLPENGKEGFIGEKTLVADKNGVVGFLNGLPSGIEEKSNYSLTTLEDFVPSKATSRTYRYNQIVYTCRGDRDVCSPDPALVVNPSYSTTFDLKKSGTEKFLILSLDYSLMLSTIDNAIYADAFWLLYDIEVLVNDQRAKIYSATYEGFKGGGNLHESNKYFMIELESTSLRPTDNSIEIKLIPRNNIMRLNAGTQSGNFATGNADLLTLRVKDVSFFVYEK